MMDLLDSLIYYIIILFISLLLVCYNRAIFQDMNFGISLIIREVIMFPLPLTRQEYWVMQSKDIKLSV